MLYFLIWVGLSFLVASFGSEKKVGFWGTFFISVLLSPIVGVLVAVFSSPKDEPEKTEVNIKESDQA